MIVPRCAFSAEFCLFAPFLGVAALIGLLLGAGVALAADPRCDGFPPRNHTVAVPRGDVIGIAGAACVGQLNPVVSSPNTDANAAAIDSIRVDRKPRHGRFEMIGLRDFRYQPHPAIKGWDEVTLRLVYRLPTNAIVSKPVKLRLTSEAEYRRMQAAGTLD